MGTSSADRSPDSATDPMPQRAANSTGWLAGRSVFEGESRPARRAIGATVATLGLHGLLLIGIVLVFTHREEHRHVVADATPLTFLYLQQAGPSGGGGGSPAPAPPKLLSVPRTPPAPIPDPLTASTEPPPPVPTLSTPVMTVNHDLAQATGTNSVSLATVGGGGRGPGLGPDNGGGVGPGQDKGFGGEGFRAGAGVQNPTVLREVRPSYTGEAMRAKIQGNVRLEAVVDENGYVSDVRVTRSLDRQYGLDQQAMKAARLWIFRPARDRNNRPVPVVIEFELAFVLH